MMGSATTAGWLDGFFRGSHVPEEPQGLLPGYKINVCPAMGDVAHHHVTLTSAPGRLEPLAYWPFPVSQCGNMAQAPR